MAVWDVEVRDGPQNLYLALTAPRAGQPGGPGLSRALKAILASGSHSTWRGPGAGRCLCCGDVIAWLQGVRETAWKQRAREAWSQVAGGAGVRCRGGSLYAAWMGKEEIGTGSL